MRSPNPTPNSLMFKWNAHKKYVCPSTHNDFAGYNVKHLVLDSGCSSMLLPITSDADRDQLVNLFADRTVYQWTVNLSGMSTCTLTITHYTPGNFPVRLCSTTTPYDTTVIRLRFNVSYVDAIHLENLHVTGVLTIVGISHLREYIQKIQALRHALRTTVGERRDIALIGQDILHGKYVFEYNFLAMVCSSPTAIPPSDYMAHVNVCESWIATEFDNATQEFNFIDDADCHGDTYEFDDMLMAWDP